MNHKKVSNLDMAFVDQIRISQTDIIMENLIHPGNFSINISLRKKWFLALNSIMLSIIVALFFILRNPAPTPPTYTFEEVYSDLINLQSIIHELVPNEEEASIKPTKLGHINPDYVKTYDYLYDLYLDNEGMTKMYDDHTELFLNASMHFDLFIDILNMYEYVPLFKWVDSVENDTIDRFKIMVHDNGFFTIATYKEYTDDIGSEVFNVFYLGLDSELFEMDHIRYMGDINVTGYETNYNYYQYHQNQQTTYINSNQYGSTYDYVSFIDNERIYVSRNHENFLEDEADGDIYSVIYFDEETKTDYNISFSGNDILSETYYQYNNYGMLFAYQDWNTSDDDVILRYNLMEALGWDEASFHPSNSLEAGIYKDNQRLFTEGRYRLNRDVGRIIVQIDLDVQTSDIDDSLLDLTDYGIVFNKGDIDVSYLDNLRINDIDNFLTNIYVGEKDFTILTDKESLYNSLLSILKNSILVVE